ncbi:MAG: NTP transferase domain-containing protein [candidate division Zixibacteria bacterium]|nr:NTP transferase domain-containing protein [candidate division Zixibacteria bacterium]MBU1469677.1 NTP transferase domain-containing protein [candidate division Zixibacteria bacterium]MBU2624746.1 NTP transferase domain-containing protein [candidate division Zixibacteria bacterium]
MKAIIMAGGFGTRLRPLTLGLPKPMVPMANRPMMEHIVTLLKKHGFGRILSLLYFQPEAITGYFEDGSKFGVKMDYLRAKDDFGTAGSVRNAADFIGNERIVIISGDVLTDFDLGAAMKFHQERGAAATMVLTHMENPLQYGVVITDDDGKITRFLEKPTWGEVFSDKVNTGIYILEPEVVNMIPQQKFYDFSKDLFPRVLSEKMPMYGYTADGYWRDVGNLTEYMQAHKDILAGVVKVDLPLNELKYKDATLWIGKNEDVDSTVSFDDVVILGDDVSVGAGASIRNCVIGDRTVIGEDAEIDNSIIWDGVTIGDGAKLKQAMVLSNATIMSGAVLEENSIISENSRIGRGALVKAGCKVWPGKEVEDEATLATSLIWGEKWNRELFTDAKVSGLANVEITPEFAAKLGATLGSTLPNDQSIVISRDAGNASRMIARSLVTGILSAGADTADIRTLPIPLVRYALKTGKHAGGIHVRHSPMNEEMIDIIFFDEKGMDLPSSRAKSLERLFFSEDFPRAKVGDIGKIDYPIRLLESYRQDFLDAIDVDIVKKRRFKVVIDYDCGGAVEVFPAIFAALNCEVISLNAFIDPSKVARTKERTETSLQTLSSIVQSLNADVGILLDNNSEKIRVVDRLGNKISDMLLLLLVTSLYLRSNLAKTICVPVVASMGVEEIASEYGVQVVRVRNDHLAMMEAMMKLQPGFVGGTRGGFIFPGFQRGADAMFGAVKILELMAKSGVTLAEIRGDYERFYMDEIEVHCGWDRKGRVMRRLMEHSTTYRRDLVDGVRINFGDHWVLVTPDRNKAAFRVVAESREMAQTKAVLEKYAKLIAEWQE